MLAPILLFTYNRPNHTKYTVEALLQNKEASGSLLIIYSDASKNENDIEIVKQTREYLHNIKGFRAIEIVEREKNYGLSDNMVDGVTNVVKQYGKAIVLEDDLLTAPYFLQYMNNALTLYEHEHDVVCIHGYVYPTKQTLPETFFLRGADCWGWATWKRGWAVFNPDAKSLLQQIKEAQLERSFDFNGTYPYTKMLEMQVDKKVNSWAIRWYASAFLQNKLTLYPGNSLVANIGLDGSGTHCGTNKQFEINLYDKPVAVNTISITENQQAHKAFESYFRGSTGVCVRLKNLVKRIIA